MSSNSKLEDVVSTTTSGEEEDIVEEEEEEEDREKKCVFIKLKCYVGKDGENVVKQVMFTGDHGYFAKTTVFYFNPPYDWSDLPNDRMRENTARFDEIDGPDLFWWVGKLPYEDLNDILECATEDAGLLLTFGDEDAAFLQQLIGRKVWNVEKLFQEGENLTWPLPDRKNDDFDVSNSRDSDDEDDYMDIVLDRPYRHSRFCCGNGRLCTRLIPSWKPTWGKGC